MPTADELLGPQVVDELVRILCEVAPQHRWAAMGSLEPLSALSLRQRCDAITEALLGDLAGSFVDLDAVVVAALDRQELTGWMIWPVTEAVTASALDDGSPEAFDRALELLEALTGRLTSEFALRGLLDARPDRGLAAALAWTDHPDEHVRRLASEGTRAFLPWGTRVAAITTDPGRTIPILDALYRDDSEYVRRSAANHLNDLSRLRADLAVATAERWLRDPDANTERVVRHALRTLVKQGHPGALAILGFPEPSGVEVEGPVLGTTTVSMGEDLAFEVRITNTDEAPIRLAIDYVVHHRKANGTRTPKVFKLTTCTLEPGEQRTFARRHSFAAISTRRYHPGTHQMAVQVNGVASSAVDFELT